jgi:stage II sporulation protein D
VTGTYLQFRANGGPISTQVPGGYRSYRGTIAAVPPTAGASTRQIVNRIGLEDYVRGVVPVEMPAEWKPEALKAQAVAARTYAAYEMAHPLSPNFHVYDDTRSQVYRGFSVEVGTTDAAVSGTAAKVLTYGGAAAFTQFSSSNGGYELAGSAPYLVTKADPNDPRRPWNADGSASTRAAEQALGLCANHGGTLTNVIVKYVPNAGEWVDSVTIGWPGGSCTVTGAQFRAGLTLPSANFKLTLS